MANCSFYVQLTNPHVHDASIHIFIIYYSWFTQLKKQNRCVLTVTHCELKTLWNKGVDIYDVHTNQTFKMKAMLMWIVNDFSTYGMLS